MSSCNMPEFYANACHAAYILFYARRNANVYFCLAGKVCAFDVFYAKYKAEALMRVVVTPPFTPR